MMTRRRFILYAAIPFALIIGAVAAAKAINFDRVVFRADELEILRFSPAEDAETEMREASRRVAASPVEKVFFFGSGAVEPEPAAERQAHDALSVSLTVMNSNGNMAVIGDRLVREGDVVGGMTVKRIEIDRVLLVDKGSRRVYLEGKR